MKKAGVIIFIVAVAVGVVVANFFSFGKFFFGAPINISIGSSKVKGSGNVETERRDLSGFKAIDVSGIFQVEIVAQKDFSVEVEADDNLLPLITTEVRGGTLEIEAEKNFKTSNSIKIRISAPNIEEIENSGVSKVYLTNLDNESLSLDSSGASKVTIEGATKQLNLDLSGASRVDASKLSAAKVAVDSSGASSATVNVIDELSADLSGASRVRYKGKPNNVEKRTSGASSVRQIED